MIKYFLFLILCTFIGAYHVNYYIGTDANWYNRENWSLKTVPDMNTIAIITNNTVIISQINITINVYHIKLSNNAFITCQNNIILMYFDMDNYSWIYLDNAILWTHSNLTIINMQIDNAKISCYQIYLPVNANLYVHKKSKIIGSIINDGTVILMPMSTLTIDKYIQNQKSNLVVYGINFYSFIQAPIIYSKYFLASGNLTVKTYQKIDPVINFCWGLVNSPIIHNNLTILPNIYNAQLSVDKLHHLLMLCLS